MNRHIDVWTLTTTHTYYDSTPCADFRFRPTPETLELMTRRGLMARNTPGRWRLATCEQHLPGADDRFVVDVCCVNSQFAYITDAKGLKPRMAPTFDAGHTTGVIIYHPLAGELVDVAPAVVARVVFAMTGDGHVETELRFLSQDVVLEYIVLPKTGVLPNLRMREASGRLSFLPGCPIDYMGRAGLMFVAGQPVTLAARSDLKIQLLEEAGHSPRIVAARMELPIPGAFIDAGAGRARAVVYI